MSNDETQPGKHTLNGDGEPAMTEKTQFKATIAQDRDGNPVLVFETPTQAFFIYGEDLFNFYAMLKKGMEGPTKRPEFYG